MWIFFYSNDKGIVDSEYLNKTNDKMNKGESGTATCYRDESRASEHYKVSVGAEEDGARASSSSSSFGIVEGKDEVKEGGQGKRHIRILRFTRLSPIRATAPVSYYGIAAFINVPVALCFRGVGALKKIYYIVINTWIFFFL